MHIFSDAQKRVQEFVSENSSTLLTAAGAVGTAATGILAFRGGRKYEHVFMDRIDEMNAGLDLENEEDRAKYTTVDTVPFLMKVQWAAPHVFMPIITGGVTIGSIIMANRMSAQRAAALAAAYGLTQKQFDEYREKVAEKLTGPKKQQIDEELAQDRIKNTPGSSQIIIMNGDDVVCYDEPTARYFKSTMEKINSAVNATNMEIINHGFAPAEYFYSELELEPTVWAKDVGWNLDNTLVLDTKVVESPEDGRPILSINFSRFPTEDYHRQVYMS